MTERVVSIVLRSGAALSFALLAVGLIATATQSRFGQEITKAGLIVLLLTPLVRVLAALATYIVERNRKMIAVCLGVIGIIAGASLVGLSLR